MHDLRFALRCLAKSPGFTAVAVLTLALGLGTTTALFTVINAVLLRPLPFPRPAELVSVHVDLRGQGIQNVALSVPELEDFRTRSGVFAELSIAYPMSGNMTGIERPERVEALAVSPNYFRLLGVSAAMGRTFGEEEARVAGWAEGVVLSDRAWRMLFGGQPGVLGQKIWMDYDTFRVVGVMPPGFRHPGTTLNSDVDVWFTGGLRTAPFAAQPTRSQRRIPHLVGRLAAGVTPAQAQSRLALLASQLRQENPTEYPVSAGWTPRLEPLLENLTGRVRPVLTILFGASSCLVLICCASIACLQLARASARARETTIRIALGASRWALVRAALIENGVLATAGGILGLLFATWLLPALLRLAPTDLPRAEQIGIDAGVMVFTFAVTACTGIGIGLATALSRPTLDVAVGLKSGAGAGQAIGGSRLRAGLVAGQIAVALVLLAGAGLLVRSYWNLLRADPGFTSTNLSLVNIWLPPPSNPNARQTYRNAANRAELIRTLLARTRALPGVEAVAIGSGQCVPFTNWRPTDFVVENSPTSDTPQAEFANVTPDYFDVLRMKLVSGRALRESDDGANPVAVIDETAARRLWPQQDAIGRRFSFGKGAATQWITVVGIVSDMKTDGFDAPVAPHIYVSTYHRSQMGLTVLIRSPLPASALGESLRAIVRAADPDLPVYSVRSMDEVMTRAQAHRYFALIVIAFFALAALTLAAFGVFGVTALVVSQRRREFGVRLALGATPAALARLVFKQGLVLALIGGVAGAGGALVLTRSLQSLLYGASPFDPKTFGAISIVLLVAVAVACWLPARRASRVHPMEALRAE